MFFSSFTSLMLLVHVHVYRTVLKTSYNPAGLDTEVSLLEDTLRQAMEALDPNSLENFITVYGFMCDYHGTAYLEDVSSVS